MAKKAQESKEAQVEEKEVGLLDQILTEGKLARDEFQQERAKDMISEFVGQVMSGEMTMTKNMDATINARVAEIDRLLTAQMNEIMHHAEFQKLEGSWRGLHFTKDKQNGNDCTLRGGHGAGQLGGRLCPGAVDGHDRTCGGRHVGPGD